MDLYCKIFVNTELSSDQFIDWLSDRFIGEVDGRSLVTPIFEIDVIGNGDFDKDKVSDPKGFVFYPYYLEIDESDDVDVKVYVSEVSRLLELLWSVGTDAVAACEFEDELPKKIAV